MEYKPFSPRQRDALLWWRLPGLSRYDALICDGAVRSGKTVAMAVGFVLWSMTQFDGASFALCGKTIESLRRNVTGLLPQWVEGLFAVRERRSEHKLVLSGGGRCNTYYLFGGKDESSYQLIQGMTLAGVLFDEVALMPRSFVEQALARCSVAGSRFWFNCNPEGPGHWFYQTWILQAQAHNALRLSFTMADNLSLSPEIRQRYERLYSGVFYQRYILGRWVAAEGLVYDMFRPDRHVLTQLPPTAGDCYVSVDYGTQNPTVFLLWRREQGGGRWLCLREYYYSGRAARRQKTDGAYADDLTAFLGGIRPRAVIVDPSAASFLAELRQRGFAVLAADNGVLSGIRRVSGLLEQGGLAFSAECVHTREEFGAYVWDERAARRGEDRPVKDNDHCMDALRYFVSTVLGRQRVRVRQMPPIF